MAICPFAMKRLIPPGENDPRINPRVAILHVDAGNAESLYEYFRDRSGGVESHFHVKKNGVIEQYRDTKFQADANYLANNFAVSIETQGYGEGEWTPLQITSIKKLLLWLHEVHPAIKLQKCFTWDASGVGYHIQFGTPGKWTDRSKSCPGPDRIRQYNNVLVPWMNKGGVTPVEETEMQLSDKVGSAADADTVGQILLKMSRYMVADAARDKKLHAILPTAVASAVLTANKKAPAGSGPTEAELVRAAANAVREVLGSLNDKKVV